MQPEALITMVFFPSASSASLRPREDMQPAQSGEPPVKSSDMLIIKRGVYLKKINKKRVAPKEQLTKKVFLHIRLLSASTICFKTSASFGIAKFFLYLFCPSCVKNPLEREMNSFSPSSVTAFFFPISMKLLFPNFTSVESI